MPSGGHGFGLIGFSELNESVISAIHLHVAFTAKEYNIRPLVICRVPINMVPFGHQFAAHLAWLRRKTTLGSRTPATYSDAVTQPCMMLWTKPLALLNVTLFLFVSLLWPWLPFGDILAL